MVDEHLTEIKAVVVKVDEGSIIRGLHNLYFGGHPPFSAPDKKNEFPDAMALLSLEWWGRTHGGVVLAVTNDREWANFAELSDFIVCVPRLSSALNLFNRNDQVYASRLAATVKSGAATSITERLNQSLSNIVEDFDYDARAAHYFHAEIDYSEIIEWSIYDEPFDIIESDDNLITVRFNVQVIARFAVSFVFCYYDNEDKEYLRIGRERATTEENFDAQVVLTVERREGDNPDVLELEIEDAGLLTDFGEVELDHGME